MPIQLEEFLIEPCSAEQSAKCELFAEVIARYGYAKVKVLGTSMTPHILPGDTLNVERAQASELVIGEIAVYLRSGRLFAHRVITTSNESGSTLVTRGDAMECDDPPVLAHEIVGRVTKIIPGRRLAYRVRRTMAPLKSAMAILRSCGRSLRLL